MPNLSANQFSSFILSDPSVRLSKLKELTDPGNQGYYTAFRQRLGKRCREEGALTSSICEEMIRFAKGVHQTRVVNYGCCASGLKRLLQGCRDKHFLTGGDQATSLKKSPLFLNDDHPVSVTFSIDLIAQAKIGDSPAGLACHLHYPFEKTPTGRPRKPAMDRIGVFLLAFEEALRGANLPLSPAVIHLSTGKLLDLSFVSAEVRNCYPIEKRAVTEYLGMIP